MVSNANKLYTDANQREEIIAGVKGLQEPLKLSIPIYNLTDQT